MWALIISISSGDRKSIGYEYDNRSDIRDQPYDHLLVLARVGRFELQLMRFRYKEFLSYIRNSLIPNTYMVPMNRETSFVHPSTHPFLK